MGIGIGVFLVAAGLILALAVNGSVAGLDIQLIGWILTGAGVASILIGVATTAMARRSHSVTEVDVRGTPNAVIPGTDSRVVRDQRDY